MLRPSHVGANVWLAASFAYLPKCLLGKHTWPMDARLDALRRQLEGIAEELAGIGYEKLKEALDTGRSGAEAQERRLSRARRSVLKAAALLVEVEDGQ
jgi:hypothetical protein